MKTQAHKSSFPLSAVAGIAVILLGIAAVVRVMGWLPNSIGGFGNILAIEVLSAASAKPFAEPLDIDSPQTPGNSRSTRRCPECSVIVSMREIEVSGLNASIGAVGQKAARSYEFTVRLDGGSRRVIIDANRASWRPGQRLIVIDGTNSAPQ